MLNSYMEIFLLKMHCHPVHNLLIVCHCVFAEWDSTTHWHSYIQSCFVIPFSDFVSKW